MTDYNLLFESGDTYFDSAYAMDISQDRALQELANHGVTSNEGIVEFYEDMGDKESYSAQKVLEWLGY
tara:strand:+ start:1175 stop:1378 length:204 start_codon:yes stop_codon:yes gene_type:complete